MTISPDVVIMTRAEMATVKDASFHKGVARGRFERGMEEPFADAMQIIELGCRLFWGRNGDGTHMDTEQFRQSHFEWYERAKAFVEAQKKSGDKP